MARFRDLSVTGWGFPQSTEEIDALMAVKIHEVNANTCRRDWDDFNPKAQICAGKRGQRICDGDSGGPLQSEVCGRVFISGIVSFGDNVTDCAYAGPDVFIRVSFYRGWIDANTKRGVKCAN